MENVIMMVNNAGDVFKLCIGTKGKQKLYNHQSKDRTIDVRVIFHISETLNDS